LAVTAGSYYLREPAALWDAVLGEPGELPEHPAIVVLPFDDISPTHDQQYLADGITEDLITNLAKIPELLVMARTASFAYKGKPADTRQVRRDLNVHYVVDGSIQRSDHDLRVTAQLIDAATGRELWAESYDRKIENIFAVRDDITRSIAGTLGGLSGKLAKAEVTRLSAKDPSSFTAYDYLMRGWYEWHKFTPENNALARDLFEQARQVDPDYARAYVGLSWAYANDFDYEWTSDYPKTLKLTLDMANDAVRLDPGDYQAHWSLGWAYLYHRQHDMALAEYARARELNPNDAELIAEMANLLIFTGEPLKAIEHAKEGIRLNPFHENWYVEYLGWAYAEAGMPKEAIAVFQKAIDLENPADDQLWYFPTIAAAYAQDGRMDEARKIVKTLLARKPNYSISESVARSFPYQTQELVDKYVDAASAAGLPK
jgi:TolB-like protein/Tfp pilus assembly protein PilF